MPARRKIEGNASSVVVLLVVVVAHTIVIRRGSQPKGESCEQQRLGARVSGTWTDGSLTNRDALQSAHPCACHSPAVGFSQMQHALESLPNYRSWQVGSGLKKDCEACKRTNHPSTYRPFLSNLLRVVVGCVLTHGRRYRLELSGPHYDARAYWSGSISVRLPSSPVLAFDCPPLTSPFPAGHHDAYSLLR